MTDHHLNTSQPMTDHHLNTSQPMTDHHLNTKVFFESQTVWTRIHYCICQGRC